MTDTEREILIDGLSVCCEAPVIIGDICTKCHDHCTVETTAINTLELLHKARRQVVFEPALLALIDNIIDYQIGIWPPKHPVNYGLIRRHAENAQVWRQAFDAWEYESEL